MERMQSLINALAYGPTGICNLEKKWHPSDLQNLVWERHYLPLLTKAPATRGDSMGPTVVLAKPPNPLLQAHWPSLIVQWPPMLQRKRLAVSKLRAAEPGTGSNTRGRDLRQAPKMPVPEAGC